MKNTRSLLKGMVIASVAAPLLAHADAMNIDANGDVGIGIETPDQALHVVRDDGSAQILVEELDISPAARDLFVLRNAGNTKFQIQETDSGVNWAFTNSGSDFRISRQGSGFVEFAVDNSGNAFLNNGTLTENSDRNAKEAIIPVNVEDILERVAALPVSEWQYKSQPEVRHIGPMAQDFHAAFGVGSSPTGISSLDTGGVALAAIKGLESENDRLRAQNLSLEQRMHEQESRLAQLEAMLRQLTGR